MHKKVMHDSGMAVDGMVQIHREQLGLKEDSRNDAETMRADNRLLVAKVGTLVYGPDVLPGMNPR